MRGHGELVEQQTNNMMSQWLRSCSSCFRVSVWFRFLLLIVTIPLNFVLPIIRTLLWLHLNGLLIAWEYHLYYFELKGYTYIQQKQVIDARKTQYTGFGMQAMALEMIPFFGFLFLFTNTVAAALFAAEMEEEELENREYWHQEVRTSRAGASMGHHDDDAPLTPMLDGTQDDD